MWSPFTAYKASSCCKPLLTKIFSSVRHSFSASPFLSKKPYKSDSVGIRDPPPNTMNRGVRWPPGGREESVKIPSLCRCRNDQKDPPHPQETTIHHQKQQIRSRGQKKWHGTWLVLEHCSHCCLAAQELTCIPTGENNLVPYLQEIPWEILAFVHSLKVGNEFLAGHLFANVLKDNRTQKY